MCANTNDGNEDGQGMVKVQFTTLRTQRQTGSHTRTLEETHKDELDCLFFAVCDYQETDKLPQKYDRAWARAQAHSALGNNTPMRRGVSNDLKATTCDPSSKYTQIAEVSDLHTRQFSMGHRLQWSLDHTRTRVMGMTAKIIT